MTIRPPHTILVVDDSATTRQSLKAILEADPAFRVVLAGDPYEAVEVLKKTIPAAILLDVNMPRMDGLTFLRKLMRQHPLPVILCTDHPEKGLEGLELGALEVVPKPKWDDPADRADWSERLRESMRTALRIAAPRQNADAILPPIVLPLRGLPADRDNIIAVGVSTGGVPAVRRLLMGFTRDSPGIVVAQHMPVNFTAAFADLLNRNEEIALEVVEARHGEPIRPGRALIVPGDIHGVVRRFGGAYRLQLVDGPCVNRFRPSVDVLFRSVAQAAGDRAVGIILTGMLDDGAQGLLEMSHVGTWTIAQDEATSVVFGMNREAIRRGAARQVLPLDQIAAAALAHFRRGGGHSRS